MKNFKLFLGFVLIFAAMFLICIIDNFSIGGILLAFVAIYFCGRDGIRLINKYSKEPLLD